MVGTIIPIVNGKSSSGRIGLNAVYVMTLILGGAVVGVSLWAVGTAIGANEVRRLVPLRVACSACLVVLALTELGVLRLRLPSSSWRVPRHWQIRWRSEIAVSLYGLVLGTGVATALPSAGLYALIGFAACGGSMWLTVLVWSAFGVGRALPIAWLGTCRADSREQRRKLEPVLRCRPLVLVANAVILMCEAGWLLGSRVS